MRDFKQFILRANHTRSQPQRMLFLDTETYKREKGSEEHHRMMLAWTCYIRIRKDTEKHTEKWRFFTDTASLCKYIRALTNNKSPLWIFAHNAFFDLMASDFYFYFTKWGWCLEFVYDQGLTFILVIRRGKKVIKVVSTTNFFDTSVEQMGKLLGLEKMEVDFEASSWEEVSDYCRRDVEIIKEMMMRYLRWLHDEDLGRFGTTRAAQSLNAYRHRFMKKKICIHKEEDVQEIEQAAYMGGRVECFRLGELHDGPFVSLDVNSMYPFIMRSFPLPTRVVDLISSPNLDDLQAILRRWCAIAKCVVRTEEPAYALRRGKKIVFPVGEFETYLCTPMLKYALRHGHLVSVDKLVVYEREVIFREFVDYFYNLRLKCKQEGNVIYERFAKYMLNSLYGKFGQYKWEEKREIEKGGKLVHREITYDLETGEIEIEYKLFNTWIRLSGRKPASNSLFAIPAHITEWGRYLLWIYIKKVGRDKVLYCDTDSIKVRRFDLPGRKLFIDDTKLGALKVEEQFDYLKLIGPKCYITEKERKLKGIPRSAVEVSPGVYEYLSFERQKTHLAEGVARWVIVRTERKELRQEYDKGIVNPDGSISPFRIEPPSLPAGPPVLF